ncbi:MAG: Gp15 family bacteriophage protein, partial [Butyricicoccaceae bacterium]
MVSSFRAQYGIRLRGELDHMPWDEFCDLLAGLGADTPLGRIVAIRAETDKEVLKNFTKEQRRIRSEWQSRRAKQRTPQENIAALESIKQALIAMA